MKRCLKFLAAAILVAAFAPRRLPAAHVVERIIARVNNEIITMQQFNKKRESLRESLAQQYSGPELAAKLNDESKNLLRNLIDESLLVQKAKDENIDVETDLIKRLDQIRKDQDLPTLEAMQKEAEEQGVNWEDFKEQIRRQLLMQEVISRYVGSRIIVTREDERKYYEAHKSDFKNPGGVHLAEILISNTKYKPPEDEKRANAAMAELKSGARFGDVVKKYSDGPNADSNGDIGFMKTGTMAPSIEAAIAKLDTNEYTGLIKIRNGYTILKLLQRLSPGIPPFEEIEGNINELLYNQRMEPRMRDYMTQLRNESYIYLAPGYTDTGAETPGSALTSEKTQ